MCVCIWEAAFLLLIPLIHIPTPRKVSAELSFQSVFRDQSLTPWLWKLIALQSLTQSLHWEEEDQHDTR